MYAFFFFSGGKKDENLIIPLNDSISGTLSMDHLCATTSIAFSNEFDSNRMWLNGVEVKIDDNKRLVRCIENGNLFHEYYLILKLNSIFLLLFSLVRKLAESTVGWPSNHYIRICSRNNFPTAAGLASSAAGYACLCYALCKLFEINDPYIISSLARLGSGSACRSIYGGIVRWIAGYDHQTSIARQVITENEWPEIRIFVCVVSDHRKDTSSTSGMQLSCQTSSLIKYRAENVVPDHCDQIQKAINERNFDKFAEITMKDSNQFHAICQDTYPPIRYMNDTSWSIVNLIHFINHSFGHNVACYTFDAGPNACIYCLDNHAPILIKSIRRMYQKNDGTELEIKGITYQTDQIVIDQKINDYIDSRKQNAEDLKYIISTRLGSGPKILTNQFDSNCLLLDNGLPKN